MADEIIATRRGVLKWLPAVGAMAAAPAMLKPEMAMKPSPATELLQGIAATAPNGHKCLTVTVRQSGVVEAFCTSADGALLHRNPHSGKWA
jgi:hypothetical protein